MSDVNFSRLSCFLGYLNSTLSTSLKFTLTAYTLLSQVSPSIESYSLLLKIIIFILYLLNYFYRLTDRICFFLGANFLYSPNLLDCFHVTLVFRDRIPKRLLSWRLHICSFIYHTPANFLYSCLPLPWKFLGERNLPLVILLNQCYGQTILQLIFSCHWEPPPGSVLTILLVT